MNDENKEKLFNDFPELWKHKDDLKASLMRFGFEHGDGWFNLVYKLCKDIMEEYGKLSDKQKERFYVQQVKEKFAGLRFYVSFGTKRIFELIDAAGRESYKICEFCGAPGTMHTTGGWYKTLCSRCAKESGKYYPYRTEKDDDLPKVQKPKSVS